ncbi:MAG: hypothetical protein ABSC18_00100 [Verrucomicrobiota bacterium]|jgi:hypothetical protein
MGTFCVLSLLPIFSQLLTHSQSSPWGVADVALLGRGDGAISDGQLILLMLRHVFSINTLKTPGLTLPEDEFGPTATRMRGALAACLQAGTGGRLRAIKPQRPLKGNLWNLYP